MKMRQADKDRIRCAIETSLINKCRLDDLDLINCDVIEAQHQQVKLIMESVESAFDGIPEVSELIEQIKDEKKGSYWRTPAGKAELLQAERVQFAKSQINETLAPAS